MISQQRPFLKKSLRHVILLSPALKYRPGPEGVRTASRPTNQTGAGCTMPAGPTAFLVVRRDDGFGDVFPLTPGQSCTLGRASHQPDRAERRPVQPGTRRGVVLRRPLESARPQQPQRHPSQRRKPRRRKRVVAPRRNRPRPFLLPLRRGHESAARVAGSGRGTGRVRVHQEAAGPDALPDAYPAAARGSAFR